MLTRSPAFGLSFEIVSVAVAKVLPGFVVVAVNVAVVEAAVELMPIKTRAESAIVARRKFAPRILVPHFFPARSAGAFCCGATILSRGRGRMGPAGGTLLAHWDYDHRGCIAGHAGITTCELVALLRELLPEGRTAARPRLERFDAVLAPRARAPPENRGGCEADEAGGRKHDRLQVPPELKLACRDRHPDERENLDLQEQHQEGEGERRGAIRAPAAVRKGDIDDAAHAARMLEEGRRPRGSRSTDELAPARGSSACPSCASRRARSSRRTVCGRRRPERRASSRRA